MIKKGFVFLTFCAAITAQNAFAEVIKSSSSADSFAYRAKGLRDPFVPLTSGAGGGQIAARSSAADAPKEPAELEKEFNPSALVIKALLGDGKSKMDFAIIVNQDAPDQNFMVQKGRIKHVGTGMFLPSYTAHILGQQVIVKKIKDGPASYTVQFPQPDKEESP